MNDTNETEDVVRGRPGRRSAEDKQKAVLELLSGKATVDQLARRYGVLASTVEKWRDDGLIALESAFRQRGARNERELALEQENEVLRSALTKQTMKAELLERALDSRPPTLPGRSRR